MEESGKERDPIHDEIAEIRMIPGEEEKDKGLLVSWDAILPDELLQKVLSLLPVANIIKLDIVCKRWYEVIHSCPLWATMAPQKPLFLTSCVKDCAFSGRVYDPCFLRWYNFGFRLFEKGFWLTSSSCGLVCLMNTKDGRRLLVGNPLKSDWKLLPQVPGGCSPNYNVLALSFDRRTRGYTVVVAKCSQLPPNPYQRHFSVHIYESTTQSWATPFAQYIGFWMGTPEAVICDGVLYCLIFSREAGRSMMAFDLTKPPSSYQSLIQESILAPNPLEFVGLINLSNKLVLVGRTGPPSSPHKEVVILELEDKTWREVALMPLNRYLSTCKFVCCGASDFLFMHFFKGPDLLTFDMRRKAWKWSRQPMCACPYKPELGQLRSVLYHGFCFEPRLDVTS